MATKKEKTTPPPFPKGDWGIEEKRNLIGIPPPHSAGKPAPFNKGEFYVAMKKEKTTPPPFPKGSFMALKEKEQATPFPKGGLGD